jgi:hypothetical protein
MKLGVRLVNVTLSGTHRVPARQETSRTVDEPDRICRQTPVRPPRRRR